MMVDGWVDGWVDRWMKDERMVDGGMINEWIGGRCVNVRW